MDQRHLKMFNEQLWYSKHVINEYFYGQNYKGKKIFEIGCAEGGGLHFFAEKGAQCYGLEYSYSRYQKSLEMNEGNKIEFIHGDILNTPTFLKRIPKKIDLLILRDVIEHLHDKRSALQTIFNLLSDEGSIFLSFPPKFSPFAGHQQVVYNLWGKLPYIYLLPNRLYETYLRLLSQPEASIEGLLDVKKLRISLSKLERYFKEVGLNVASRDYFLIRPAYEKRFGWKRIKNPLATVPILREITTLGTIYILTKLCRIMQPAALNRSFML